MVSKTPIPVTIRQAEAVFQRVNDPHSLGRVQEILARLVTSPGGTTADPSGK